MAKGIVNNAVAPILGKEDPLNPQTKDLGIYARIIIPLDAPKERINCNTLYQLELQRRRLEADHMDKHIRQMQPLGLRDKAEDKQQAGQITLTWSGGEVSAQAE